MPLDPNYITNRGIEVHGGKRQLRASAIIHDVFTAPATGSTLTLSAKNSTTKILAERMDGAPAGVAGTVTVGSDSTNGVYTPATAPNGAHSYDVWYISDTPEQSL